MMPGPFADRRDLGDDALEPRRPGPAVRRLVAPGSPPGRGPARAGRPAPSRPSSRRPRRLLEPAVERREPPRPAGHVGVVRVAQPVVVRSTSRAPGRPRTSGSRYTSANRHARYGPMSTPGSPAVIQPAIARPIPPPPPKPLSDRPAATQKPRTPGQRPEQRVGVGGHRVRVADEADRLGVGEEREAPDRRRPSAARTARSRAAASARRGPTARRPPSATRGRARSRRRPCRRARSCRRRGCPGRGSRACRAAARDPGTALSAMCW